MAAEIVLVCVLLIPVCCLADYLNSKGWRI